MKGLWKNFKLILLMLLEKQAHTSKSEFFKQIVEKEPKQNKLIVRGIILPFM